MNKGIFTIQNLGMVFICFLRFLIKSGLRVSRTALKTRVCPELLLDMCRNICVWGMESPTTSADKQRQGRHDHRFRKMVAMYAGYIWKPTGNTNQATTGA